MQKLVSKITGTWPTSDKQWKSKKLKFDGLFSKTYIPSAKTLYTVDLSNINFNYLCIDSLNYLCHFWNHMSFFRTQLLCIITTAALLKKRLWKRCFFANFAEVLRTLFSKWLLLYFLQNCKLSDLTFTKFLMPFFKLKVSFSAKSGSFFSVMKDDSSVLFRLRF